MPDAALPDDSVLTEAFWTPNVRQQVVTQCTSITRPAHVAGRLISETDTGLVLRSDGTDWHPLNLVTPWTGVSFANSWMDAPTYQGVQYRRRGDMVDIRGTMQSGTLSATAFTLPAGFRPPDYVYIPAESNGAFGLAVIAPFGGVTPVGGSNARFGIYGSFSTTA